MRDLDEAEAFARRVLAADGAVHRREDGAVAARDALCTGEVARGLREMPVPLDPAAERRLFKVVRYEGGLFGAVASQATTASKGQEKYELQLFLRDVDGAPQVVSVWFVCTACIALGEDFSGGTCIECGGFGWERWFGERLDPPPAPVEERRLERPGSLYISEYTRKR